MEDKIAVAKKIHELLGQIIRLGGFRLKYRIVVDPVFPDSDSNWEAPVVLVEFSGTDSGRLKERGGELLRSIEHLALEIVGAGREDHLKVSFDCDGFRRRRLQELKLSAQVAADKVRETGVPYVFAPMSSLERRAIHLSLREAEGLKTQSEGEGAERHLVIYPEGYTGKAPEAPAVRRRR
jgi:spoIIIJ-associated protein